MNELKFCPLCGKKVRWISGSIRCQCGLRYSPPGWMSKETAETRWNTRAEQTCHNISDPPEGFLCSLCGWGDFAEPSHLLTTAKFTGNDNGPNHCPNCGARVEVAR